DVCQEGYACAMSCLTPDDCAEGQECNGGQCANPLPTLFSLRACALDADCLPGDYCELSACTHDCVSDRDCTNGDVCTSRGRCLPPESIGAAIASPLPEPESAILRIEPERISLSGPTHDAQVGIANEGGLPLPFRFEVDRSWVDVQPPKGVLAPGQRL